MIGVEPLGAGAGGAGLPGAEGLPGLEGADDEPPPPPPQAASARAVATANAKVFREAEAERERKRFMRSPVWAARAFAFFARRWGIRMNTEFCPGGQENPALSAEQRSAPINWHLKGLDAPMKGASSSRLLSL